MEIINSYRKESIQHRIIKEQKIKSSKNNKFSLKNYFKQKLLSSKFISLIFKHNPSNLILNKVDFKFKDLPENFNNYKILFLSDLHLDIEPNSLDYIDNLNINNDIDILILGGDIFDKPNFNKNDIANLKKLLSKFNVKKKIAVLGNHDSYNIIDKEKELGIKFLLNESIKINKNNESIIFTGFDDYTLFHSFNMTNCLIKDNNFKIAISHNPDLLIDCKVNDYNLQLSGHTHGGQIKLPFIIESSHTKYSKCIKGKWKHNLFYGFTSSGFGCSTYPLRNIPAEIVLINLRRI